MDGSTDLRNTIGMIRLGGAVTITLVRNGERHEVEVAIARSSPEQLADSDLVGKLNGAKLQELPPSHPRYGRVEGVLVIEVGPGSPAARNGLRPGDIVLAVNRTMVRSVTEFAAAVRSAKSVIAFMRSSRPLPAAHRRSINGSVSTPSITAGRWRAGR